MRRWDGESHEIMYERCGIGSLASGVNCGVVECMRRNMLRWFEHIERMGSEEFVKKVYVSESVGPNSRGRPYRKWRDRVKEYMGGRTGPSKEGVFGELETFLLWPSAWGMFPEGARNQSYR